jgi:hypothetical protein
MPNLSRWPHTPFKTELANFRAARDDAANTPVDIMYWGNSITYGSQDTLVNGGFPARVGNMLNAKLGLQHGVGYEACRTTQATSRWVLTNTTGTSTGGAENLIGFGQWSTKLAPTDTVSLTATMDRFELLYTKHKTLDGEIEVRVDGVLQATLSTYDSAQANTYDSSCSWDSGALSPGSHTILITGSGADFSYIEGGFVYNTNYSTGFRVWNGATAGKWGSVPSTSNGAFDILAKRTPDLAVWCHFFNDRQAIFLPIETYYGAWIQRFIDAVRERSPDTDILLCSEWETAAWNGTMADYDAMRQLMKDKAAENGVAYLDLGDFVESMGYDGTSTDPFDWLNADLAHPNSPQGFQRFADIHHAFLVDNKPPSRPQGFTEPTPPTVMENILTDWTTDPVHGFWVNDPLWTPPADGDPVSSWRNGGTAGGEATSSGSSRPTYRAEVAVSDGAAAIEFSRTGPTYLAQAIGSAINQTYWVVVLASIGANIAATRRFLGWGNNGARGVGASSANQWQLNTNATLNGGATDSSAHLFVAKLAGASSTLHVDGTLIMTGNTGTLAFQNTMSIGSANDGTTFMNGFSGNMHAIMVFDTDPTAQAEWADFEQYAATLGITVA